MGGGRTLAAVALAGIALVAVLVFVAGEDEDVPQAASLDPLTDGGSGDAADTTSSPFATDVGEGPVAVTDEAAEPVATGEASAPRPPARVAPLEGPVDVSALGRSSLDDDAFEALAARLATDPELMAALVDEFRSETDPERLARLARLLGEAGGPAPTALAAELVYTADGELREIGLDLLRRVQPGNADARDIVSGLLSNGTDRDTLVPVLQTLTRPGVVPVDERTRLAGQVALLSTHADPGVRRLGIDVLSRWSEGSENVPSIRDGLNDTHPGVREAAAYALVGRPDTDGTIAGELFAVADDPSEEERVRRAAILALKNLPLEGEALERRVAVERALDRLPAR